MDDDNGGYLIVMALAVLFSILAITTCRVACTIGERHGEHAIKLEAVEKGKAKWIPKKDGTTVFEWLSAEGP